MFINGGIMKKIKSLLNLFIVFLFLVSTNIVFAEGPIYPASNGKYYYDLNTYSYTDYTKYPFGYDSWSYQHGYRQSAKANILIPLPKADAEFIKYKNDDVVCFVLEVQAEENVVEEERPGQYGLPEKVSVLEQTPRYSYKGFVTGQWIDNGSSYTLTNTKVYYRKDKEIHKSLYKYIDTFLSYMNNNSNEQMLLDDMLKKFAYAFKRPYTTTTYSSNSNTKNLILRFPESMTSLDGIRTH